MPKLPFLTESNREKPGDRIPGELTEFDLDVLGRSAIQIRIPLREVTETRAHLEKLAGVIHRARFHLDQHPQVGQRAALFAVRALLKSAAQEIGRVKRKTI